jgi:predicted phosphodiesterase
MRIAILSDIHGNSIALDAVLRDIQGQGVDGYWFLGDYAAIGVDPVGVLERITALPNATFIRGNTDHYITSDDWMPPNDAKRMNDPAAFPKLIEIARCFAWAQGAITTQGWLEWVANLPLEHRVTLPDGTRVLLVHAAPGMDDGPGIYPTMADEDLRASVTGCEADLVFVGHIHWPFERQIDSVRVINVASVSNPPAMDLRAKYAVLEADTAGWHVSFRQVEYDYGAVLEKIRRSCHPAAGYIRHFFEGKFYPDWL